MAQEKRYTVPYLIYRHGATRAAALSALRKAVSGFVRAWDFNFKHNEA